MEIGPEDVFEREYTAKFKSLASKYGEFVEYRRDRGARDLGLHFTRRRASGGEVLTPTLAWFQLKGITKGTLDISERALQRRDSLALRIKVRHLRFWFYQPMPTYLVVYVQSADTFLVTNIKKYVETNWGTKIFGLQQDSVAVHVPASSVLDQGAFWKIMVEGEVAQWVNILGAEEEAARRALQDYELIYRLGTAKSRNVTHRVTYIDYQSKLRSELYFAERQRKSKAPWKRFRTEFIFMMHGPEIRATFPYLRFRPYQTDDWWDDEDKPVLKLSKNCVVTGENVADEYHEFKLRIGLNSVGLQMFEWVQTMMQAGMLAEDRKGHVFVDRAPWNSRDV